MSKFHVTAVFTQFPWLHDYFNPSWFSHAEVRRMDTKLLSREVTTTSERPRLIIHAIFFDQDGNALLQLGVQEFIRRTPLQRLLRPKWKVVRETIGEALQRLDANQDKVHYLAGYELLDYGNVKSKVLFLLKPPKQFSISEWLSRQRQIAADEIAVALENIDASVMV